METRHHTCEDAPVLRRNRMGKYDRLIAHLNASGSASLTLPLAAIDALVTGDLPVSRARSAWWSGDKRPWAAGGFDAQLDPTGTKVSFTARRVGSAALVPSGPAWPLMMNEAAVELRIVLPLLARLGFGTDDIAAKVPLTFQQGRRGRKPEADFIVFDGPSHTLDTSLLVVEAILQATIRQRRTVASGSVAFAAAPDAVLQAACACCDAIAACAEACTCC